MTIFRQSAVSESGCLNSGSYVTDRFGRVFGDENDGAHRCPECDSHRRLSRGSAAGKDVEAHPDPETSPGCHGGKADV